MASRDAQIKIGVGFDVDKSGIEQIRAEITKLATMNMKDLKLIDPKATAKDLGEIHRSAVQMGEALQKSFNTKLGTVNVTKFKNELDKIDVNKLYTNLSKAGTAGQSAFRNMATEALTTNSQIKQTSKLLDGLAGTVKNTVKWGLSSSIFNGLIRGMQQAYSYTKDLDRSLNDIRIVTGASADEMDRFAIQANKAAKNLATSTTDYTQAALIYYQQGLSDADVAARTETTLKTANVTQQSAETVSELLTAVWNGYKVDAEEAETYVDKLAAVAATTASDLNELSIGMSKVASAANLMGVDVDQLNATLATVVSVTRQAPESVGTAFKTIYARMSDIQAGLDSETTLDAYTKKVKEIAGVSVLDQNNQLRDMGDVIEEIGNKWTTMSREQQIALAQAMAGTRQYNNLLALYDNWDMYNKALETSKDSTGALQKQQDTYLESTAAHIQSMKASFEDMYDSIFNTEGFNDIYDLLGGIADNLAIFVNALGGGGNALLAFGSIATRVFSNQISSGIVGLINNIKVVKNNFDQLKAQNAIADMFKGIDTSHALDEIVKMKQEMISFGDTVTKEQEQLGNSIIKATNELKNQTAEIDAEAEKVGKYLERVTKGKVAKTDTTAAIHDDDDSKKQKIEDIFNNEEIEEEINKLEELNKKLKEVEINRKKSTKSQWKKNTQEAQEYGKAIREVQDALKQKINSGTLSDEELRIAKDALKDIDDNLKKVKNDYKEISPETIKKVNEALGELTSSQREALEAAIKKYRELEEQARKNIEKQKALEQAWKELKEQLTFQAQINAGVKLVSTLGQVASSIRMLTNLANVWSDDTKSSFEKVLTTVETLGFSLTSLIPAIKGFKEAKATLTAAATAQAGLNAQLTVGQIAAGKFWQTLLGWPGLVIAGLVAVTYAVVKLIDAFTLTPVERLEMTKDAARDLKKTLEETKSYADKIKSSLESYDSAVDKLNNCTKGTQEWRDALKEVNNEVLTLLENYPDLEVERNEDGQLVIKNGEEAQEKANTQVTNAQTANIRGQQDVREAELNIMEGKIIDSIGTQIRDLSSKEASDLGNAIFDNIDTLSKNTDKENQEWLSQWLKSNTSLSEGQISSIEISKDFKENLSTYASAVEKNTKAIENSSLVEANSIVNNNEKVQNSKYAEDIEKTISKGIDSQQDKVYSDLESKGITAEQIQTKFGTGKNVSALALFDEYKKATGNTSVDESSIDFDSKKNKISWTDAEGEHTQSLKAIETSTVAAQANENLAKSAENLISIFEKLENSNQEGIVKLTSDEKDSVTKQEFDNLEELSKNENGISDYLKSLFSDEELLSVAESAGYLTADEYIKALEEEINDNPFDNLSVDDMLLNTKDLSVKTAKSFQEVYDNIKVGPLGEQVADDYIWGINNIISKVSDNEKEKALNELLAINPSDIDSFKQFQKVAENFGIEIDKDTNYYENLLSKVRASKGINLEQPLDNKTVSAELKEESFDAGTEINTDKYKELLAIYPELADNVIKVDENTYRLTEDLNKLSDVDLAKNLSEQNDQLRVQQELLSNDRAMHHLDGMQKKVDENGQTIGTSEDARAQLQLFNMTGGDEVLEKLGYSQDVIQKLIQSGSVEQINTLGKAIQNFLNPETEYGGNADQMEYLAASAKNAQELSEMLNDGSIDVEQYNKRWEELQNTLDSDVTEERVEGIAKQLQNLVKIKPNSAFSQELEKDKKLAEDVAEELERYNSAVKSVQKNYSTWKSNLTQINKALEKNGEVIDPDTINELGNAYSDFLGMATSGNLSTEFLTDAKNLELMKAASEGNVEAYNKLQEAAGKDIIAHLDLDEDQYAEFNDKLSGVQSHMDELNNQGIKVGADLDDGNFLNELTNMVNAAGMTADQATDYLSTMGIDAEVETAQKRVQETVAFGTTPRQTNTVETGQGPNGEPLGKVYGIAYETKPITAWKTVSGSGLKVTSAKKSSGGGIKFNNSGSGSPDSSGKKGSGGGGSSSKQPNKMDPSKDVIDRYHDINLVIKRLGKDLEKLQEQQEKLAGKDLVKNLNDQLKIIEKQKQAYEEKLKIEREEQKELQKSLGKEGVKFDKDGYIKNYAKALKAREDLYNKEVEKYNKMSADEQEKYKETVDKAKEDYEEFKKNIERYDQIIGDEIPDLEKDIRDALDQEIEIKIKKFTTSIDLRLNMAEAQKDFREFQRKVIKDLKDDDILGNLKADFEELGDYFGANGNKGIIQALKEQVAATEKEVAIIEKGGTSKVFGKDIQKAREALDKYNKELADQLIAYKELEQQIRNDYYDAIDEVGEKWQKQNDAIKYTSELIEHNKNLVGLIYGDKAYDKMAKFYKAQKGNLQQQMDNLRSQVSQAYSNMKNATDEEARKRFEEQWKEALSNLNSAIEESAQNIIDIYTNAVNEIFQNVEETMANGRTFDEISNQWDLITQKADFYLDEVNKAFSLQSITNKYQKSIDETSSVSAQRKLNQMMEKQMKMLREKDKLTQYDVERAEKMYELTLKQIALEEAQQNKSNMRLRRDSQGNYSYQFVADDDAIAKAQEELDKAQVDMYNADKEQLRKNAQESISKISDLQNKLRENELDTTLGDEQRAANRTDLTEQLKEVTEDFANEFKYVRENYLPEDIELIYGESSPDKIEEILNKLLPELSADAVDLIDKINNGEFSKLLQDALKDVDNLKEEFDKAMQPIKDDLGKIGTDGKDTATKESEKLIEDRKKLLEDTRDELKRASDIVKQMEKNEKTYKDLLDYSTKLVEKVYKNTSKWDGQDANESDGKNKYYINPVTKKTKSSKKTSTKASSISNFNILANNLDKAKMSNMINSVSMTIPTNFDKETQTIEQNVHIEAIFQDATKASEIQEALSNLVNLASQKAFENKR